MGNQVGAVRTLAADDGGDAASAVLTGYVVINSDNLDEAARLAGGCPGLQYGGQRRGGRGGLDELGS
jgi:hypothetical protein